MLYYSITYYISLPDFSISNIFSQKDPERYLKLTTRNPCACKFWQATLAELSRLDADVSLWRQQIDMVFCLRLEYVWSKRKQYDKNIDKIYDAYYSYFS